MSKESKKKEEVEEFWKQQQLEIQKYSSALLVDRRRVHSFLNSLVSQLEELVKQSYISETTRESTQTFEGLIKGLAGQISEFSDITGYELNWTTDDDDHTLFEKLNSKLLFSFLK